MERMELSESHHILNNPLTNPRSRRRSHNKSKSNRSLMDNLGTASSLEATLRDLGYYDDANEPDRRAALDILEKVLDKWACDLQTSNKGPNERSNNPWQRPRVAVVTFGSYRLGVHKPSSDLDVLCLSPPHCTRADFFSSLVDQLKQDPRVSEVHPISTAYTPVIKFVLQGIQIDLLFARLSNPGKLLKHQRSQPSPLIRNNLAGQTLAPDEPNPVNKRVEYSIDDSDLVGLDEAGVRSVNGARVSQRMLELVPNVDNFRLALRAIKAWADVHGVQSNVLGFLGGINWAILVARIAMEHPMARAPQLLRLFFQTYSRWKWPEPVTLGPILTEPPPGNIPKMTAWDPSTNPRDGLQICPIITPAYPSMNSAYNVGIPQLRRIQDEMSRAAYVLENTKDGSCRDIFEEGGFFHRHSNYLQINIRARNSEDYLHWFRLCESRLRLLIASLETPDVHAWPFAKFFERNYGTTHEAYFFIALRFAPGLETVDLRYSTSEFLHKVNSWEGRKEGMDISIGRISADELPAFVVGTEKIPAKRPTIDISICPQIVLERSGAVSPTKKTKVI